MEEGEKCLDLSGKRFSGGQLLKELKEYLHADVTRLDLTTNQVTPEVAQFLANFLTAPGCCLVSLSLVDTRMTIEACSAIFKVIGASPLIELYADDNVIKPESLMLLANSFKFSSPLEILSLVGCDISSEGFEYVVKCLSETKNLHHLRMESNSIYENGVRLLGEALDASSLTSIEIADNMIWMGGMTSFLEKAMTYPSLTALDISYNAVDLTFLSKVLVSNTSITHLAISGCKVNEQSVLPFIESLSRTHLKTLIMDGFNYQVLPISWPQVNDTIFFKHLNFEAFTTALISSDYLEDVRIGYLELEQIHALEQSLSGENISKSIKISVHDFGRTHDCWVLNFPAFSVDSPVDLIKWCGKLDDTNATYFGRIAVCALYRDDRLSKINLSSKNISDSIFIRVMKELDGRNLTSLDASDNALGNESVDSIISFLHNQRINELNLAKNHINEHGTGRLFKFFNENPDRCPRVLEYHYHIQNDNNELNDHQFYNDLANFLKQNMSLQTLKISGTITPIDVLKIVNSLKDNNTLQILEIDSEFIHTYMNPDPQPERKFIDEYVKLVKALKAVLYDGNCVLQNFKFDLLTEVFIYCDQEIVECWDSCLAKLKKNKNGRK
ncbi:Leucine Rich Repeat family protein [Trichomonas vaginalis G3]|uniref:Leucine Rich Repeat family protein n=1 Tax=Trichomonas vaginalis (strain ATCC PRA-98 / G3) TaxID=412133 RepID=A2G4A9_TRIV3|nr:uncharacterized protein TVAGG3_0542710 [Trichomonas vaginalis G3]EAX88009.1 Leucine Rich Repeat family protein [Trichomonas vaginalis G3]KAI5519954.1 GTPase activator protein [Trichomonas vaginalis G3]|eukprot:XP_001300939.1 hypothetical protein [Trichomonas vaginalis G3]